MMDPIQEELAELFRIQLEADGPDLDAVAETSAPKVGATAEESVELGRLRLTANDVDGALAHFRRAQEQANDPNFAREDIAGALEYGDREAAAFREYERVRGRGGSTEATVGSAELYRRFGRFKDSVARLEAGAKDAPEDAFVQFKLAQTLRDSGERTRALEAGLKALAIDPKPAYFHFWVADLLVEMRRYEESIEHFRAALERSPGDDYFCLRSAIAFWGAGRPHDAIRAIGIASELDPDKTLYFGVREMFLRLNGDSEEAIREAERASRMDAYDRDMLDRIRRELLLA